MIPHRIHQIWIGNKRRPDHWMQTWRDKNPTFEHHLWTESEIDALPMLNRNKYEYYLKKQNYPGAADVARVEILFQYGGIYMDADSVCRHTLEGAPFLAADFFAAYEYDYRIANGVIGNVKEHPILRKYRERISEASVLEPACFTIGGTLLTTCVDLYTAAGGEVWLLPSFSFYPKLGHYREATGTIYARQMWGTTKGIYEENV